MYQLLFIPLISGFIGYITNVVAIKLLFWPRRPVNLGLFCVQGVLPKRRGQIAEISGKLVEEQLLSLDDLFDKINTSGFKKQIQEKLSQAVQSRLIEMMPAFVPGKITKIVQDMVDKVLRQESDEIISKVIVSGQEYLDQEIRISNLVAGKINSLDLMEIEKMVREVSATELKFIERLGGILGLLIGLVEVGLLLLFPLRF